MPPIFSISNLKAFLPLLGLNMVIALSLFVVGRYGFVPHIVQASGYANFASDSFACHSQALELMAYLSDQDWQAWWDVRSRFHTRLASVAYFLWGEWTFYSNLSFWPINALALFFSWVVWNRLTFQIGGEQKVTWKCWLCLPILCLHHTQLLRDPFYICILLWWVSFWIELFQVTRTKNSIHIAFMILLFSLLLLLVRERLFVLAQLISISWLCLAFLTTLFKQHSIKWFSGVFILVLIINAHSLQKAVYRYLKIEVPQTTMTKTVPEGFTFFYKVSTLRQDFIKSYQQSSNIDGHVEFKSDSDVINYIPRALQIGLFSPFPNMWWDQGGKTGRVGRIVSAFETIFIWFVMVFAFYCLIRHKPNLAIIMTLSVVLITSLALGLVVTNNGALYRMRLGSWLLWLAICFAYWPSSNQLGTEQKKIATS